MHATEKNKRIYWDSRALDYPRPFEPAVIRKTRMRIRKLEAKGIVFKNKDFLDIGCGSGIYALPLAHRCRTVTGIDSSKAMLENFKCEAQSKLILNAFAIEQAWENVPVEQVEKKFDIAFASMTAAVQSREDVLKMEVAAKECCVYIGWAGERHNSLLEQIYAHHGVKYLPPPGSENILSALDELRHKYDIEYSYEAWFKIKTIEATMADIEINMRVNDAVFDKEWTENFLKAHSHGDLVRQKTKVKKATIIWQPQ